MTAPRRMVAVQMAQFALAGVLVLALVAYGTSVASRRAGERQAIVDARATTVAKAQAVVEPAITDGLLTGDPAAVARVAETVERNVLDESLVRVRIWTRDGTIVYSDEPRVIGATYELDEDDLASLDTGEIEAEVSDLSKPENRFERKFGKLLEVYLPISAPGGQRLLFEAYYRYEAVEASGTRLWRNFAPISLGALVLLELVQLPLAYSLARRLRERLREREGLLQRALDASSGERRQIAADLHDSVVQDLAGVTYALDAAARNGGVADARLLEDSAATVRESIKALRSLVVEIYPPDIAEEGLVATLSDLLARTSGRGVVAQLDAAGLREPLPTAAAGLLYRVAQEGLRNVLTHADATELRLRLRSAEGVVVLEMTDDGRGFDPVAGPGDGHLGLRGLRDLVTNAGGKMDVESSPGTGTTLRVEVPA